MPLSLFLLVVVVVVASAAKGEMLLSSTLSRAPSPAFLRFNGAAPICWAVTWSRSSVGNRGGRLSSINSVSSCHGSGTSGVSRAATTMIAKPSQVVVVGATGRLGRRVVRELLVDDVAVTAAVRPSSVEKADAIFKDKNFMPEEMLNKLEVVAVDLESGKELRDVMGKSQAVVCALGAAESEPFNIKGPSEVDGRLSQNVVVAAKESPSIKHFVLVTALGTGKFGLPASLLNLFWGVLSYKRKTENLLLDSGLPYTILRPGGMERPGDDFEQTHNARIAPKDTLFGGVVSRLQVAKLAAAAVASPDDSTNKVMEIVAEDLAPKVSYNDLVAKAKDDQADEVWKNKLRPDQYYVLRMGGTEPAFTSPLNGEKREGAFVCAGCDQELFPSSTKYNSGTGWPSFFQPTSEESVRIVREGGLFNRREVRCSSCDGHLGHVFPDGPRPTGLRYCMNGVALGFKPKTMTTVNQDKDQDKSQPVEGEAQQV